MSIIIFLKSMLKRNSDFVILNYPKVGALSGPVLDVIISYSHPQCTQTHDDVPNNTATDACFLSP